MTQIMVTAYCATASIADRLIKNGANVVTARHDIMKFGNYHDILRECQGLVLSGGEDISPSTYRERNLSSHYTNIDRDKFELSLIEKAAELGIKMLGICRGHQLLNVAFAGTLIQDMRHASYSHEVSLASFGQELFSDLSIQTNSLHHQAVDKLGEGFEVIGRHTDGTIEAIYSPEYKSLGVQWHPEMMDTTQEVFRWLST